MLIRTIKKVRVVITREVHVSTVKLTVNGKAVTADVEDRTRSYLLRDHPV